MRGGLSEGLIGNDVAIMPESSLPPQIRELTVVERLALIERIWDSIVEDETTLPLTDAQKAELDRRLARRQDDPDRGLDWDQVKQRLVNDS